MTPLEAQFEILKVSYPAATLTKLPSGAAIIRIPNVPVPAGWSKTHVTVRFLAPVGYPMATPDCFWVDPDLRLGNGGMPQGSNMNPMPEVNEPLLWFSWHVGKWNPNRDNLVSYTKVIESRLKEAR